MGPVTSNKLPRVPNDLKDSGAPICTENGTVFGLVEGTSIPRTAPHIDLKVPGIRDWIKDVVSKTPAAPEKK